MLVRAKQRSDVMAPCDRLIVFDIELIAFSIQCVRSEIVTVLQIPIFRHHSVEIHLLIKLLVIALSLVFGAIAWQRSRTCTSGNIFDEVGVREEGTDIDISNLKPWIKRKCCSRSRCSQSFVLFHVAVFIDISLIIRISGAFFAFTACRFAIQFLPNR